MRQSRLLMTSLLLVLIAAFAIPFTVPMNNGKPLLEFSMPRLATPELPDVSIPEIGTGKQENNQVQLYRWKDAGGVWQFANTPPSGVAYEVQTVDTNTNIIQAVPTEVETAEPVKGEADPITPLSGLSPSQAMKTLEDAKKVQSMVDEHKAAMDRAIEGKN